MTNGRQKGKRGELELCAELRALLNINVRRSVQYCGDSGDSDLIAEEAPGLFIECKRVEHLQLDKAVEVAVEQCKGKVPAIFHKRNRKDWLVTVRLSDLRAFVKVMSETLSQGGCHEQGEGVVCRR